MEEEQLPVEGPEVLLETSPEELLGNAEVNGVSMLVPGSGNPYDRNLNKSGDEPVSMESAEYDANENGMIDQTEKIKMTKAKFDTMENIADKLIVRYRHCKFDNAETEMAAARELRKEIITLSNPPNAKKDEKKWYDKVADKAMWIFIIVWTTITAKGILRKSRLSVNTASRYLNIKRPMKRQ